MCIYVFTSSTQTSITKAYQTSKKELTNTKLITPYKTISTCKYIMALESLEELKEKLTEIIFKVSIKNIFIKITLSLLKNPFKFNFVNVI